MTTYRTRAEVVGSLLQPARLLQSREALSEGRLSQTELTEIENEAVLEAINLQESVGLDVITDGEMRRPNWSDTRRHIDGLEMRICERSYPNTARLALREVAAPTVVSRIIPKTDHPVGEEYPFLRAHAKTRTKYTMAAPSYHRRYWSDELSKAAYRSCEEFLIDIRNWLAEVAQRLVSEGCDYIQLDAPSYGSICDPETRAFHEARGHRVDEELAFDAGLDSSLFEDLSGVTRALHICRGNGPGGKWHVSGGYAVIADQIFPNLDVDVVLLEYDTDRAGDFAPIAKVKPGTTVVLGLLTTKSGNLEDENQVQGRIVEASKIRDLSELAISTQCGFASATNALMTTDEQRAKLELVARVAHRVWA